MEKRAIIAALLMAGLLIAYQTFFMQPAEVPPPPPKAEAPGAKPAPSPAPVAAPAAVAPAAAAPVAVQSVPDRTATVETPLYRAAISSRGGVITVWDVHFHGDRPMVLAGILGPSGIRVVAEGRSEKPIQFRLSTESLTLDQQKPVGELVLTGEDGFGLQITCTLRFRADTYVVEQNLKVENRHTIQQGADISTTWAGPVEWPKDHDNFPGPRPLHVIQLTKGAFWPYRSALTEDFKFAGVGAWVGLESSISHAGSLGQAGTYLVAFVPKGPGIRTVEGKTQEPVRPQDKNGPKHRVEIGLVATIPPLAPRQAWEGQFLSYLGPMEFERLKALGVGLEKAIYFGGFPVPESKARDWGLPTFPMEWIAVPVFWLLQWLYRLVPNYGVAIILLTVITKLIFFPLTVKSMRSMKAMQALQPQINALRSKHKSDPQRVQRETMELYRANHVNPLGGCLPMVVQIPVFYALYVALSVWADIQNAPFICFGKAWSWLPWIGGQDVWICDLADADHTYILPILMGVSMLIQQKMTPTMGDPRQAKMMLIMPVVFTFMFLSLPSGLVLYWTLSNVLQIAQQLYMERSGTPAKPATRAMKKA
jgi:YidC/Oxa1 family membrane protein insertase